MIGTIFKYNADHTAEVLQFDDTHVLVRLDTGDKYCVAKSGVIEEIRKAELKLF